MEAFYVYILQVNAALLVFYLLYRVLFSRDTFLEIRRLFLASMIVLAFIYPGISLSSWLQQQPQLPALVVNYAELLAGVTVISPEVVEQDFVFTWQHVAMLIWGSGILVLLSRMFVQLFSICLLALRGERLNCYSVRIISLQEITSPFSFFGWIFINPACHDEKELQEIIAHESAHVRQWHSMDMILGELLSIFFWFSPIVWLLRKEIRQNLEFLADENVVSAGYNRKNYQYHLLRLSHQSTAVPIVNNFNVTQLKKRIIMMNKKKTSRIGLIKYALLLPVTGLLILAGNAQAVADLTVNTVMSQKVDPKGKVYQGRVVDEQNKPLRGVTVIIKGSSIGVSTDSEGKFSISAQPGSTLAFSYVGKKTKELVCDKNAKLEDVVLSTQAAQLDRVVVVGYNPKVTPKPADSDGKEIFMVVEDMPKFKDGNLHHFLARIIKYPVKAMEQGIVGQVYVSFVIDNTGKVTQPKIVKGVCESLDKEALRVVGMMPDWIPGKQRGVPVDVLYTIPIEFRLDGGEQQVTTSTTTVKVINGKSTQSQSFTTMQQDSSGTYLIKEKALYIVDGIKQSASFTIKDLNHDDIKSFSVLKDKSAIAIYGSEGKNGVIIITTKEGEKE